MKKLLLGTTALVLLSGAAVAQQVNTKSPFTVSLNGSMRYNFAFFDQDASGVNRESSIDSRILLTAEAKADNGLTYGYMGRLRSGATGIAAGALGLDYSYIYASGTWGQVMLGDHSGALTQLEVIAPTVGIGQADQIGFLDAGNASLFWASEDTPFTRTTYITPSFSGFQAAVSYAPEQDIKQTRSIAAPGGAYQDIFEIAASYTGEFGDFGLKVGAGYEFSGRGTAANDYQLYNIGIVGTYAGFSLGASFYDNGEYQGVNTDQYGWAVGLTYEVGSWAVGASYNRVKTDLGAGDSIDQIFGVGGAYQLAPGLSLQADVIGTDAETSNNEGWGVVMRTRVDF
ncbi:porin [Lacibacterium aquatile]|uniref:Porin n=1 Tax=Lacibacterium aquatile TaxID=1168082 RepID=A0ABW5DV24_9PROT